MRKPIQIQVTYVPEGNGCASAVIKTVLCDDGTMWVGDGCHSNPWEQLPPIPQPVPEGGE